MLQVMFLCYGFLKCKPTMRSLSYSFVTNILQSILLKYASVIKADVWGWWDFFDLFCTQQVFFIFYLFVQSNVFIALFLLDVCCSY